MTIFRLYSNNGNTAGFWVQHRSWSNHCARVQSIGGRSAGALPGSAPAYDGAEIVLSCFDVRSGRPIDTVPSDQGFYDRNFDRIAEPGWCRTPHPVLKPAETF